MTHIDDAEAKLARSSPVLAPLRDCLWHADVIGRLGGVASQASEARVTRSVVIVEASLAKKPMRGPLVKLPILAEALGDVRRAPGAGLLSPGGRDERLRAPRLGLHAENSFLIRRNNASCLSVLSLLIAQVIPVRP